MRSVVVTPYPARVAVPQQHRETVHIRIRVGSRRAHVAFPNPGKPFDTCNPAGKLFQSVRFSSLRAGIADWLSVSSAPGRLCQFFPALKASGSLIPTILSIAIQSLQKSFRGCTQAFHFILSASLRGLVGRLDGHQPTIRKIGNVRQSSGEIRHEQR